MYCITPIDIRCIPQVLITVSMVVHVYDIWLTGTRAIFIAVGCCCKMGSTGLAFSARNSGVGLQKGGDKVGGLNGLGGMISRHASTT